MGDVTPHRDPRTPQEIYDRTAAADVFPRDPRRRGEVTVTLDAGNMAVIMEALAHYHDNGPRQRSCRETQLAMLRFEIGREGAAEGVSGERGLPAASDIEDQLPVRRTE
ncbi:MAG TPA: hypothetical protein VMW08_00425 [Acidimicrobiales bacterium]|nr:hypothetical protein [Acidimicrobiales bacterium]